MKALIILSSLGIISLLVEMFHLKKFLFPVVLIGLAATVCALITEWGHGNEYYHMMKVDGFAICFSITIVTTAFLWLLMSYKNLNEKPGLVDHVSLALFSLTGGLLLTSYFNLTMLFLGVEILSIPLYVLAGSMKDNLSSNEAGFKYFLMGSFASGFLLFGIALIYGSAASFNLDAIADFAVKNHGNIPTLFYAGILLILVGLAFKVSAVPFHFWAPDVYQGAPTVVTAFMSTVVKTAMFAAFYRLFNTCFGVSDATWSYLVMIMAAATMIVGNITAVYQSNVKRMLAYSSISHAGFMLVALVAMNALSAGSILYYTVAYSISTIGAFTVFYLVSGSRSENVDAFNGLGKKNPLLAFAMTVAMLSLAGIPPLAGFFAKYYVFVAALKNGYVPLVIIALLASLVGVYYYFRIIIAMYFKESDDKEITVDDTHKWLLVVISLATLAIGILPDAIIKLL